MTCMDVSSGDSPLSCCPVQTSQQMKEMHGDAAKFFEISVRPAPRSLFAKVSTRAPYLDVGTLVGLAPNAWLSARCLRMVATTTAAGLRISRRSCPQYFAGFVLWRCFPQTPFGNAVPRLTVSVSCWQHPERTRI